MQPGFPEYSDSFLAGQDVLYAQFNDRSFYIEDKDQEHMYFNILKRLFPNIKLTKIFPLNGKLNVISHAKDSNSDKNKIYIVDLDFDAILGSKEIVDNLFYLKKYSVENYLVDRKGIYEIIRERNPKLKDADIDVQFSYDDLLVQCKKLLSELACSFIVNQQHSLGKKYFGLNPARDFDIESRPVCYKNNHVSNYFLELDVLLKEIDGRFTIAAKIKELKGYFSSLSKFNCNVPGKYLILTIKYQLENAGLINQNSCESFAYKLSKECSVNELEELKIRITNYVNG